MIFFVLGFTGCTSIEAREMDTQKPFPGLRYLNDPRHAVYGNNMKAKAEEADEQRFYACVLLAYGPIDFLATLGLDTILLPFDVLGESSQGKKELTEQIGNERADYSYNPVIQRSKVSLNTGQFGASIVLS